MSSRSVVGADARFIVLEGIDGCGKTSVALRLQDALSVVLPRRPFYTREPSDEVIRRMLLHEDDHRARLLLFMLDRVSHARRIRQALDDGHWVLCDRYLHSTLVYNPVPVLDGLLGDDGFYRLVRWFSGDLYPDLVLWLDCDVELALSRIRERGLREPMDDIGLLSEARRRYSELQGRLPGIVRVDASGSLDEVVSICLETIYERFGSGDEVQ